MANDPTVTLNVDQLQVSVSREGDDIQVDMQTKYHSPVSFTSALWGYIKKHIDDRIDMLQDNGDDDNDEE